MLYMCNLRHFAVLMIGIVYRYMASYSIPNVDLLILILCMYCHIKYAWLYTFSVEVAAHGGAEVG